MDYNKQEIDTIVRKMYPQSRLSGAMFADYVGMYLRSICPYRPVKFFEEITITEYPERYCVSIVKTDATYEDDGKTIVTFGDGYVQRYDAETGAKISSSAPWQVQNCLV